MTIYQQIAQARYAMNVAFQKLTEDNGPDGVSTQPATLTKREEAINELDEARAELERWEAQAVAYEASRPSRRVGW